MVSASRFFLLDGINYVWHLLYHSIPYHLLLNPHWPLYLNLDLSPHKHHLTTSIKATHQISALLVLVFQHASLTQQNHSPLAHHSIPTFRLGLHNSRWHWSRALARHWTKGWIDHHWNTPVFCQQSFCSTTHTKSWTNVWSSEHGRHAVGGFTALYHRHSCHSSVPNVATSALALTGP